MAADRTTVRRAGRGSLQGRDGSVELRIGAGEAQEREVGKVHRPVEQYVLREGGEGLCCFRR